MRSIKSTCIFLGLAGLALLTTGGGGQREDRPIGADHREAPGVITDPAADINDVYAFVNPNDTTKVVMIMTVNPFQAPGNPQFFSPNVLYQFKIDNDGDFVEDLVIQATFTKATADQQFSVVGPAKPKKTGAMNQLLIPSSGKTKGKENGKGKGNLSAFTGPANATPVTGSAIVVAAGLFDDPFFFDLVKVGRLIGILPGGPVSRSAGVDFFAGFNVSALVVEVPASALKGSGNKIHIWATTSRGLVTKRSIKPDTDDKDTPVFVQVDRTGLPAISTVLIRSGTTATDKGKLKDDFNKGIPSTDLANFKAEVSKQILALPGNDQARADTLAGALLPDVLTLDVTSTAPFLNGRAPQDDVIDAELDLLTNHLVPSDGVNANDKAFLPDFPFLAKPHSAAETVPVRE